MPTQTKTPAKATAPSKGGRADVSNNPAVLHGLIVPWYQGEKEIVEMVLNKKPQFVYHKIAGIQDAFPGDEGKDIFCFWFKDWRAYHKKQYLESVSCPWFLLLFSLVQVDVIRRRCCSSIDRVGAVRRCCTIQLGSFSILPIRSGDRIGWQKDLAARQPMR